MNNSSFTWKGDSTACFLTQFSAIVRERRVQLDLSQEELGVRAGVTRSYISDIETGLRNNLSMKSLYRVASALEWTPAELLIRAEAAYTTYRTTTPIACSCESAMEM